jgi:methyl-accepting chemotaxis protein
MKKILGKLKMFYKLLISPLVVVIFLIILAVLSFTGFSRQKDSTEDIFKNRFRNFQESAAIVMDLTKVQANIYKIMGWANANYEKKKIEDFAKEQGATLEKAIAFMKGVVDSNKINEKERGYYKQALAQTQKYNQSVRLVMDSVSGGDTSTAAILMGQADDSYQVLDKSLRDLMELEKKLSQGKYEESMTGIDSTLNLFMAVAVIAVILSLLINVLMARLINAPLRETVAALGRIADGDLTQEITVDSRDEIGELARSVNQMCEKMGEAVGQSVATSRVLSEAASEQAAAIEETSSSLEEMSAMTRQNAESTAKANELMIQAKDITEKANGAMSHLTLSMTDIAQASEQTQKIVKTIDEIAFQTNLLALNAAVEAARAGEAGAGFAVVADEVRNLALRAAEAARNTSSLMGDIVGKVKEGERLVEMTNSAFSQVSSSSGKVVELVGEIAAASQEQSQGIDQVNKAVAEMSRVTQQNAASAEELASIMALFRTNQSGFEDPSCRRLPVVTGKPVPAFPGKIGSDNQLNRRRITGPKLRLAVGAGKV